MKICVIGNSHVASIKRGLEELKGSNFEVDFFADRGARLRELKVDGGVLRSEDEDVRRVLEYTSGGKGEIRGDEYDIFVLYGLYAKGLLIKEEAFFSEEVVKQTVKDHVASTTSFDILLKLRKITKKKVFIGHDPFPAAEKVVDNTISRDYVFGMEKLNRFLYSPLNCEIISQPSETVVNKFYTDPTFSKESSRLNIGEGMEGRVHPESEKKHMNSEFGKLWLEKLLKNINKQS
ncbi:hypothetical protein NPJ88_005125 [Halomonas elongata]|uniref:hypothetical protein n=1 Tax=Halomonas elongata TaxID=2746 RepID=UPI00255AEE33|nr:hypothetical protein [Halomonas elongata]MDL4861706.1 hypothetical protein [Halomonas elongata]